MTYRSIFGDDLTDYEVEVITRSGIAEAQWDRIGQQINTYNNAHSARSSRAKLIKLLKASGALGSTAIAIGKLYYNRQFAQEDPGRIPGKKVRTATGSVTSKSASNPTLGIKEDELKHKVPAKQPHGPPNKPPETEVAVDAGGNISPKAPQSKKKSWWEDTTLQDKDRSWLHKNDNPQTQAPAVNPIPGSKPKSKMADVEMNGPDGQNNTVTPVSRFQNAFEGIPRQYTTILPYWSHVTSGSLSTTAGSRNANVVLRMNSIYDVRKSDNIATFVPDPTVAAQVVDGGTKEKPMWRDYWGQFWEYWTVVECRWKISGHVTNDSNDHQLGIAYGYTGLQQPPYVSSGSTDITYNEYQRWKGFKVISARSSVVSNQLNNLSGDNCYVISGVYHPGDGVHEVAEDELVETWIKGDNVPKEANNLWVRFFYMPQSDVSTSLTFTYSIELEYVVQYKDQKAIWQFPHVGVTSVATSLAPA